MQIDWLTVSAQIVNFLVLVYLLKRFLYRPVLTAMETRERAIAERIQSAEEKDRAAQALRQAYEEQAEALEMQRTQLLDEAKQQAEARRESLLAELRDEMDRKRAAWQAELDKEQAKLQHEIRSLMADSLVAALRKILADLADADLERAIIRRFVVQLNALPGDQKETLVTSTREDDVIVATSFPMDESQTRLLEQCLKDIGVAAPVVFQNRPELIGGVLLETGGQRWTWSMESYLDELAQALDSALRAASKERSG
jgi:F-type H+-transporting ATPase subunit b